MYAGVDRRAPSRRLVVLGAEVVEVAGNVEGWPIWVREAGLGFVGVGASNEEGAVRGEECVKMDVGLTGVEKVF